MQNMFSSSLLAHLEKQLSFKKGGDIRINKTVAVAGGSINTAYELKTTAGSFFLKINDAEAYPNLFVNEAKGLELLWEHSNFSIPKVELLSEWKNKALLVLEFISSAKAREDFWGLFGKELAVLHRQKNAHFGLDHDNYIGSLPQCNLPNENWHDFFILQRLEPLLRMARDEDLLTRDICHRFDRLFLQLPHIFPVEQPALLHGDLWGGNFMFNAEGKASIFDPAVYYGHREMDIAMTQLFGGFNTAFYDAYQEHYPLEVGWERRMDIANLYPLLVHVNLFGGVYVQRLSNVLRPFR
jgi:fructosamine-3-kinase